MGVGAFGRFEPARDLVLQRRLGRLLARMPSSSRTVSGATMYDAEGGIRSLLQRMLKEWNFDQMEVQGERAQVAEKEIHRLSLIKE